MAFVVLIAIILLVVSWPYIMRFAAPYFQRWMMGKFEDRLRRMAGMPTRKEEKKAAKKAGKNNRNNKSGDPWRTAATAGNSHEPIIPKDYAEDVEFVEVKTFKQTEIVTEISENQDKIIYESQIEDVEFVEYRLKNDEKSDK